MADSTNAAKICLCMIVKNEAHVIRRCLDSVRDLIDHWVIVDTGSTDGTQALIREVLNNIPGELHEEVWVDFSHNRNQALDFARSRMQRDSDVRDYALVIDADETLVFDPGFERPTLTEPAYDVDVQHGTLRYARNCVVALDVPWRYEGVLHEVLTCPQPQRIGHIEGVHVFYRSEGARSQNPRKYHDDAAVLEKALAKEPDNARYWFYLGQSYRDAGEPEKALAAYERRAGMAGWDEETWFAQLRVAQLKEALARSDAEVAHAYAMAYQARPTRCEPLIELARFHRERQQFALAMLYARRAAATPRPADRLFIDEASYSWRALDELSIAAFYTGDSAEGRVASERLLAEANFPESDAERIRKNAAFYSARGD